MNEQDKKYVKSIELYHKEQQYLISMIEQNIDNSKKMIELHKAGLKVHEESLKHEKSCLEFSEKGFSEWLKNKKL